MEPTHWKVALGQPRFHVPEGLEMAVSRNFPRKIYFNLKISISWLEPLTKFTCKIWAKSVNLPVRPWSEIYGLSLLNIPCWLSILECVILQCTVAHYHPGSCFSDQKAGKPKVLSMRVSQGFLGTREHWKNIEGNISQFLGTGNKISKNYSTKTFWESVGTWEHRAILEGNKGTQDPPGRPFSIFSVWAVGLTKISYCKIERHFPMKPGQSVGIVLSIVHSVPQCHVCTNQFMEMER